MEKRVLYMDNLKIRSNAAGVTLDVFDTRAALVALIRGDGHEPERMTDAQREDWGRRLALAIGRRKPWGRDMIRAVIAGKLEPGRDFAQAVMVQQAIADKTPAVWAASRSLHLQVNAAVEPGALLTTPSRNCAACHRPFIPHSWNDKCCSPECDKDRQGKRQK